MDFQFVNSLYPEEINRGVRLYRRQRLWFVPPLFLILFALLFRLMGATLIAAMIFAAFAAEVAGWAMCVVLKRSVSTKKIDLFKVSGDGLQITDDDGTVHRYRWDDVRVVAEGGILVLCLPARGFSIVSKRNMTPGQANYLLATHR